MQKSIFISSTFNDMHYERDAIRTKVFPYLNSAAQKYGDSVTPVDLRWGIDTENLSEEKSSLKVLNVCMDEIKRCGRYMIVILGNRYGWIPDEKYITSAVKDTGFELEDLAVSVTELEIRYGEFLSQYDLSKTLFYFREIDGAADSKYLAEDDEHETKLKALKEYIGSRKGAHIRTYHVDFSKNIRKAMDGFSDMVIKDLLALFKDEWAKKEKMGEYELDQMIQWEFVREKSCQFAARYELIDSCKQLIHNKKGNILIHGTAGSGKSTLACKLCEVLKEDGYDVAAIMCGYTQLCSSGYDIIRYIAWIFENRLGIEHRDPRTISDKSIDLSAWNKYINELLKYYDSVSTQDIVFIIDGTDQLIQDDIARNYHYLPSDTFEHIHFVTSMITAQNMPLTDSKIEISALSEDDVGHVIEGILSEHHVELSDSVIDRIIKMKGSRSPLYLSLIVHRLMLMNMEDYERISGSDTKGIESINNRQMQILEDCPEETEQLSVYLLNEAANIIGGQLIGFENDLIAVSRRGLRITDLAGIVNMMKREWSYVDTIEYLNFVRNLFIFRSDGRIDFAHRSFREGYLKQDESAKLSSSTAAFLKKVVVLRDVVNQEEYHLNNRESELVMHNLIAQWLDWLPHTDMVRSQELIWHAIKADQKTIFGDLVAQFSYEKNNIIGITNDIVESVLLDNGVWLIQALEECKFDNCYNFFSGFIDQNIFFNLVNSPDNLIIKVEICEKLLELALLRNKKYKNNYQSSWDTTIAYDRLANVHKNFETKEHRDLAIGYSMQSVNRRTEMMIYLQRLLDKKLIKEIKKFNQETTTYSNIHITQHIPDEMQIQLVESFLLEIKRGICIAYEDIVSVLMDSDDDDDYIQALKYIEQCIDMRLSLQKEGAAVVAHNSNVELGRAYGYAASICLTLYDLDQAYQTKAAEYCDKSIEYYKAVGEEDKLDELSSANVLDNDIRLAAAYSRKALLFIRQNKSSDQILEIYNKSKDMLEDLYIKDRSPEVQSALAELYNKIGIIYRNIGDADQSELYLNKAQNMAQEVSFKLPSIQAKRNYSRISMNASDDAETYRNAYQEHIHLLEELGSKESYDFMEDIYDRIANTISSSDSLNENAKRRILSEIQVKKLDCLMMVKDIDDDDIRRCVVRNEFESEAIVGNMDFDYDSIPSDFIDVLDAVGITEDNLREERNLRAYQITDKAACIARELVKKTDSLDDKDILVVTLQKLASFSLAGMPSKFGVINDEATNLARELYAKTKRGKYQLMILSGSLGNMLKGADIPQSEAIEISDMAMKSNMQDRKKTGNSEKSTETDKENSDSHSSEEVDNFMMNPDDEDIMPLVFMGLMDKLGLDIDIDEQDLPGLIDFTRRSHNNNDSDASVVEADNGTLKVEVSKQALISNRSEKRRAHRGLWIIIAVVVLVAIAAGIHFSGVFDVLRWTKEGYKSLSQNYF